MSDDASLAKAAAAGDRQAFADLARRHAARLAAYLGGRIRRVEVVEALIEEALVEAWRQRARLGQAEVPAAWLRRIAAEVAKRWYREHADEPIAGPFPVDRCDGLAEASQMSRLENALGMLAERDRLALEHRFRGGIEGAGLAEALHVGSAAEAEAAVEGALRRLDAAVSAAAG